MSGQRYNGGVPQGGETEYIRAAKRRSAEARRCPRCGRKSALKRISLQEGFVQGTLCRWGCGYDHTYDPFSETREEAEARWAQADSQAAAVVDRDIGGER